MSRSIAGAMLWQRTKLPPIYQKSRQPPLFDWERQRVMVDTWEHGRTVVVWEEGPHGWMWVFPCGGMLNGTSWEVAEAEQPKGVWVEPYDGCVVSVYQEVAERAVRVESVPAKAVGDRTEGDGVFSHE